MATAKKTNSETTVEEVVTPVEETPVEKPKKSIKTVSAVVNADSGLNLRSEASTSGSVVTIIPFGAEIKVVDDPKSEWVKATTADGSTGFVMKQFLDL